MVISTLNVVCNRKVAKKIYFSQARRFFIIDQPSNQRKTNSPLLKRSSCNKQQRKWPVALVCRQTSTTAPVSQAQNVTTAKRQFGTRRRSGKTSLVIFDKDGTLICFDSMWTPWARKIAENITHHSKLNNVNHAVHRLLGYCPLKNTVKRGLLAEGTMGQIKAELTCLLVEHGLSEDKARNVVAGAWFDCDTSGHDSLKSLDDLHTLFKTLKENDIKIAICTSDNRKATETALTKLNLMPYVDMVCCGDDPDNVPKPHPYNALKICRELDVHPDEACMVGDTIVDVLMGKSARLGSSVGVLSGVGRAEDLRDKSDILLQKVGDLVPHLISGGGSDHVSLGSGSNSASDGVAQSSASLSSKLKHFFLNKYTANQHYQTRKYSSLRPLLSFLSSPDLPKYCSSSSPLINLVNSSSVNWQQKRFIGNRPPPTDMKLTHIVVGAGSAGCVLASRLTEDSNNRVLLLEAGPSDDWWRWKIHMPTALMYNLGNDRYNWYYHTLPEVHMNERVMYCPRGRVWGGSSALNAMVYIRGHAHDYDRWVREGAAGWSYAECLPYFKKAETFDGIQSEYRGNSGPLHVHRYDGKSNPLYHALIEAGDQAGYGKTDDMNGYRQEGFGYMDGTIYKGKRWSASQAYLHPVLNRPNLYYESRMMVSKLIMDKNRCVGVEIQNKSEDFHIRARHYTEKDVILCGGSINSPQLLMLSGIGHEAVLAACDIPLHMHLPGVGQNLQDHLELYVQQACTQPITLYDKSTLRYPHKMAMVGIQWFATRTGLGATSHLETGGFVRSDDEDDHPNIQFHFLPSLVIDHGRKDPDRHAYQVHVGPMRPTSRGFVKVVSRNPFHHPAIYFNYLATEFDRKEFRQCVEAARRVFAQKAFDPFRGEEIQPGKNCRSDKEIDAFVRVQADSAYHPSCTCKMGAESDPNAVVNPKTLNVYGTDNLKIVDASIMPSVVSGNLNAPVIMMAEKAADIIRGRSPLPASNAPVWSHKEENQHKQQKKASA